MYNRLWLHLYKRKYTRNWEFAYNKMDVQKLVTLDTKM